MSQKGESVSIIFSHSKYSSNLSRERSQQSPLRSHDWTSYLHISNYISYWHELQSILSYMSCSTTDKPFKPMSILCVSLHSRTLNYSTVLLFSIFKTRFWNIDFNITQIEHHVLTSLYLTVHFMVFSNTCPSCGCRTMQELVQIQGKSFKEFSHQTLEWRN